MQTHFPDENDRSLASHRLNRIRLMPITEPLEGDEQMLSSSMSANDLARGEGRSATQQSGQPADLSAVIREQTEANRSFEITSEMQVVEDEAALPLLEKTMLFPVLARQDDDPLSTSAPVTRPLSSGKPRLGLLALIRKPAVQAVLGVLIGIALLVVISRFVDLPAALQLFRRNVTTPRGALFACLTIFTFFLAFCIRALRWKLFLNMVGRVSTPNVIALFLSGVFLNFVLPIRAGELVKSIVLKRSAQIPFNQSLPTITMDKIQDLLPAFFVVLTVPFLGVQLDSRFWYVLGAANIGLLSVILFVVLTAWKRSLMIALLKKATALLPGAIGQKIEGFAVGFVDSLLLSARRPGVLLLAVLLTGIAVVCDGLYNYFAFWTIGYPISLGSAIFGYMIFNIFYILPNPPGQVGSNEVVGLLIFTGLLHVPAEKVIAMMISFHLWTGLLMCITGMTCLSTLGVRLSSMMKLHAEEDKAA